MLSYSKRGQGRPLMRSCWLTMVGSQGGLQERAQQAEGTVNAEAPRQEKLVRFGGKGCSEATVERAGGKTGRVGEGEV